MNTREKIEKYMIDMNLNYNEIADETWMIEDDLAHIDNIIVKALDPIVLFRVNIMQVPNNNKEEFYRKILELNACDLLHGAYAIENNNVIIVDTLESEHLDYNEFQSTIESIGLALVDHFKILSEYAG